MTTATAPEFTAEQAQAELDATKEIYRELSDNFERFDYALALLHKRRADKALGYKSWRAFIEKEFPSIKVRRSYQILKHNGIVEALENATGYESGLNEGQTRDLPASAVPEVAARTLHKIKSGMEPQQAHAAAIAEVREERKPKDVPVTGPAADDEPELTDEQREGAASLQEASEGLEALNAQVAQVAEVTYDVPEAFADEPFDEAVVAEVLEALHKCSDRPTLAELKRVVIKTFQDLDSVLPLAQAKASA